MDRLEFVVGHRRGGRQVATRLRKRGLLCDDVSGSPGGPRAPPSPGHAVNVTHPDQGLRGTSREDPDRTSRQLDFDERVDQETGASQIDAIQQGVSEVSDELRSQIRSNSIDTMIRGVLLLAAGVVLWLLHGPRTSLYGNWLMPARRKGSTEPPTEPPNSEEKAADAPDERFPPPPSS